MSTRSKLIIFFGALALMILITGLLWAVRNRGNTFAVSIDPDQINPAQVILLLDDHLDKVAPEGISTYTIKVFNNSDHDLNNLRIYGYLALPIDQDLENSFLPAWLVPESARKYPAENYYNYVINLKAHSSAETKLPVEITKYSRDQNKVFSRAYLQLIKGQLSFWNIFRLEQGYSGPVISIKEDITNLE
jgi:hypothetical protein